MALGKNTRQAGRPSSVIRAIRWPVTVVLVAAVAAAVAFATHGSNRPSQLNVTTVDVSAGETLSAGQTVLSTNGNYELVMQSDGDLVEASVYDVVPIYVYHYGNDVETLGGLNNAATDRGGAHAVQIWDSGTAGHPGAHAVMQEDGNLVVLGVNNSVLWSSSSSGYPGAHLAVQDDANLVVYSSLGRPIWANNKVSVVAANAPEQGANMRSCPAVADECVATLLPNSTGVTMRCWLSVATSTAVGNAPSNKWFYVTVANGQNAGTTGFMQSTLVNNQITTPGCITGPNGSPYNSTGTQPVAPTTAVAPPVAVAPSSPDVPTVQPQTSNAVQTPATASAAPTPASAPPTTQTTQPAPAVTQTGQVNIDPDTSAYGGTVNVWSLPARNDFCNSSFPTCDPNSTIIYQVSQGQSVTALCYRPLGQLIMTGTLNDPGYEDRRWVELSTGGWLPNTWFVRSNLDLALPTC